MPCDNHEKNQKKIDKLEEKVARLDESVKSGWNIISENKEKVSILDRNMATQDERSKSIFKLLENLDKNIEKISNKLDVDVSGIKEEIDVVRTELKETKEKLAINDFKTNNTSNLIDKLTWKGVSLLAGIISTTILTIINMVLDNF